MIADILGTRKDSEWRTPISPKQKRNERLGTSLRHSLISQPYPKGSRGTVVQAIRNRDDGWVAVVEWDLPRETAFIAAMVLDTSINVMRRGKPVADQFSRTEYETLVRVLQPESRS